MGWESDELMEGFYRSAQPTELNFSFLEKLKLKSLIWVGAEEPSDMLYVTCMRI
jgi:tyrosine-protein phosphatase OCA1